MYIGIAPDTLAFLFVGINVPSIKEIAGGEKNDVQFIVFLAISLLAVFAAAFLITREAKKHLMIIL